MGEGTSCLSVNCPSVPNDDCSGAVPIDLGSTGFDTRLATTDGPAHPKCKEFDGGVTGNDVWYLFTAPDTGTLTVSTCNTADYDSDLIVYDGVDCADLVLLGCNDDTEGCDGYTSHVEVPVEMGASYLIRLGGWQEGSVGTGTLLLHLDSGR